MPFREPLYQEVEKVKIDYKIIEAPGTRKKFDKDDERDLVDSWNSAKKKMIVCGLHKPDLELNYFLGNLVSDPSVAIITETTSNLQDEKHIGNIDAVIDSLDENGRKYFQPEILITIGGSVTSKKLKTYLRKYKPQQHWHISVSAAHTDTFQSLTKVLRIDESYLFSLLYTKANKVKSTYAKDLRSISEKGYKILRAYCKDASFTDLKAMDIIWSNIPKNSDVHLGNSSPVRYANLFETKSKNGINYYL